MNSQRCHYKRLEVATDATFEEIRSAFKRLALKVHPDKNPDNQTEATVSFRRLLAAYLVLSNKRRRQLYDQETGVTPIAVSTPPKPSGAADGKDDGPTYEPRLPADIFSPFARKCTCENSRS